MRRAGAVGGRRTVADHLPRGYDAPPTHTILRAEFETDLWCSLCGERLSVFFFSGSVRYAGCRNDPRMQLLLADGGRD